MLSTLFNAIVSARDRCAWSTELVGPPPAVRLLQLLVSRCRAGGAGLGEARGGRQNIPTAARRTSESARQKRYELTMFPAAPWAKLVALARLSECRSGRPPRGLGARAYLTGGLAKGQRGGDWRRGSPQAEPMPNFKTKKRRIKYFFKLTAGCKED
jgi:hypothetical protein